MLYATTNGTKSLATPNRRGVCPFCGSVVIPKCGAINVWHWAHESRSECDTWAEREGPWHLKWKAEFLPEFAEVSINNGSERHIADIHIPGCTVIEFQHSALSVGEIIERATFYQSHGDGIVWVFDVREPYENDRLILRSRDGYVSFRWKHPRKTIAYALPDSCYLDTGSGLLELRKMYIGDDKPCGGWGYLRSREQFIDKYWSL